MAGHERRLGRAERKARDSLVAIGREIRLARLSHDLSQEAAAAAIGGSQSGWSRMEHGSGALTVLDLARAMSVVGLDLQLRAYPGGSVLRDEAHVRLLERLRTCLGPGAVWRTEVPLPVPGDQRAWDAFILIGSLRVGVEAETRVRDAQELQRGLRLKVRDGAVDRLVLLLSDTRHHRALLRAVGEGFLSWFPVDGRTALSRLELPADPGGNAIILR